MKNILALFGAIVAGVILANAAGSPAFALDDLLAKARQAFSLDDEQLSNHPALQEWRAHEKAARIAAKKLLETTDYNDACNREYMRLLAINALGQNPPQNPCPK
jgi:hypothetical protein